MDVNPVPLHAKHRLSLAPELHEELRLAALSMDKGLLHKPAHKRNGIWIPDTHVNAKRMLGHICNHNTSEVVTGSLEQIGWLG